MSQFEGNTIKVRCVDCSKLKNTRCTSKNVKVAPKKKRVCGSYSFSGSYENREDANSRYVPYIDKKTRKLLRQFTDAPPISAVLPEMQDDKAGFEHVKSFPVPATTASKGGGSTFYSPDMDKVVIKDSDGEWLT